MLSVNPTPTNPTTGAMAFKGKPSAKELKKFEKNDEMLTLLKRMYDAKDVRGAIVQIYYRQKVINILEKLLRRFI